MTTASAKARNLKKKRSDATKKQDGPKDSCCPQSQVSFHVTHDRNQIARNGILFGYRVPMAGYHL